MVGKQAPNPLPHQATTPFLVGFLRHSTRREPIINIPHVQVLETYTQV